MNEAEAHRAVSEGLTARAVWAYPHDRSWTRAEGRVIAYNPRPMVLIETDDGERVWWLADLVDLTTAHVSGGESRGAGK